MLLSAIGAQYIARRLQRIVTLRRPHRPPAI